MNLLSLTGSFFEASPALIALDKRSTAFEAERVLEQTVWNRHQGQNHIIENQAENQRIEACNSLCNLLPGRPQTLVHSFFL